MFRNKILYLMVLAEILLLCILYRNYVPVCLLYIAVLFPFCLVLQLTISKCFVQVQFPEDRVIVTRESDANTYLTVRKSAFFPTGALQVKGSIDGQKYMTNVYFRGRCQGKVSFPIDYSQYGIHRVKMDRILLFDIMRLFHRRIVRNKEIAVIVVPKIYPIAMEWNFDENLYDGESEHYSETKPGDDPAQIFDIRDYQEGDRLSRIHWKISMKLNRVMVKEYSRQLPDGVDFYIDMKQGKECMDVLFSLGLFFVEQGIKVWVNQAETKETEVFVSEFMKSAATPPKQPPVYTEGRKLICCFEQKNEKYETLFQENAGGQICFLTDYRCYDDAVQDMGIRLIDMSNMDVLTAFERILNE